LIVDDHPVVRKGLRACLARSQHLKVVGEAADGEEVLRKIRELAPDVVLMDINLPGRTGLEVTELLRKEAPRAKVLAVSVNSSVDCILRIMRAGAQGYVSKTAQPEELVRAIEVVYEGDTFFSPEITAAALSQLVGHWGEKEPSAQLNAREQQVLALITQGLTNNQAAGRLGISVRTVESYRRRLMSKLNIYGIAGLTRFALGAGIISLERPNV
jgi:two-component system response regulator NreC